eukprot:gene16937-23210_t
MIAPCAQFSGRSAVPRTIAKRVVLGSRPLRSPSLRAVTTAAYDSTGSLFSSPFSTGNPWVQLDQDMARMQARLDADMSTMQRQMDADVAATMERSSRLEAEANRIYDQAMRDSNQNVSIRREESRGINSYDRYEKF